VAGIISLLASADGAGIIPAVFLHVSPAARSGQVVLTHNNGPKRARISLRQPYRIGRRLAFSFVAMRRMRDGADRP
jgi:hypothetical protein